MLQEKSEQRKVLTNLEKIYRFALGCTLMGEVVGAYFGYLQRGNIGFYDGILIGGAIALPIGLMAKTLDVYLLDSER